MTALLALGPYIFEILPLNLQTIEEETAANWPEAQRFGVGPARQYTGPGEATMKIEGLCFNEEFGGYRDYLELKDLQAQGDPVDVVGWGEGAFYADVLGPMCILKIGARHERLGPDGIGRKITFSVELAAFGGGGAGGLW